MLHLTCRQCARPFYSEDHRSRYCSRTCYQEATGRPDAYDRTCTICGTQYTSYEKQAKYCSQACYNQRRAILPRQCPACGVLHVPKDGRVAFCSRKCSKLNHPDVPCTYCGKLFHGRLAKHRFCSLECYHASMASLYPRSRLNFSAREKRTIFKRDGYCCVDCGATDRLEADHILAICNGGTRSLANGQTLCDTCHDKKSVADRALARARFGLRESY